MSHDFKCHYYLNEGFHLKVKLGRILISFDQLDLECDILCT